MKNCIYYIREELLARLISNVLILIKFDILSFEFNFKNYTF